MVGGVIDTRLAAGPGLIGLAHHNVGSRDNSVVPALTALRPPRVKQNTGEPTWQRNSKSATT
jgi:hypothetical protein